MGEDLELGKPLVLGFCNGLDVGLCAAMAAETAIRAVGLVDLEDDRRLLVVLLELFLFLLFLLFLFLLPSPPSLLRIMDDEDKLRLPRLWAMEKTASRATDVGVFLDVVVVVLVLEVVVAVTGDEETVVVGVIGNAMEEGNGLVSVSVVVVVVVNI